MSKESTTERYIIYNALQTPDGTIIESTYTHEYVTHLDKNGKVYMVDGGKSYIRRSAHGDEIDMSIYSDDPHIKVREYFTWGTFGKSGIEPYTVPVTFKKLKDLTDDHIKAILETQHHIPEHSRQLFETELKYRDDNNEHIKEPSGSI